MDGLFKPKNLALNLILAIGIFFTLLYFASDRHIQLNAATIDIYLTGERYSRIKIYMADANGHYSERLSNSASYPPGDSGHSMGISIENYKVPIRLDPSIDKNTTVLIKNITINNITLSKTVSGNRFNRYIISCVNARCSTDNEGLHVTSTSDDPQILLKPGIIPLISPLSKALFLVISLSFLLLIISWIEYLIIYANYGRSLFVLAFAVALFMMIYNYSKGVMFFLVFLQISGRFVLFPNALQIITRVPLATRLTLYICGFFYTMWCVLTFHHIPPFTTLMNHFKENEGKTTDLITSTMRSSVWANKPLMNADAEFKVFKLKMTPNAKTIIGKDNWFFEGYGERKVEGGVTQNFDNVSDFLGLAPFSIEELAQWKTILEDRYYWLKERDIDYVFVFAPVKAQVYPEFLPNRLIDYKSKLKLPSRYDQLVGYLKEHSDIPFVALEKTLIESKGSAKEILYYGTDFHWNYLGSFYAYQEIAKKLNEFDPLQHWPILELNQFNMVVRRDWAHPIFLTLAGLNPARHMDDTYISMIPKDKALFRGNEAVHEIGICNESFPEWRKIYLNNNGHSFVASFTNDYDSGGKLFILGDSFAEVFSQYLSTHFKQTYVNRSVITFPTPLIEKLAPDVVVQELLSMYLLTNVPSNPKSIKGAKNRYLSKGGDTTH